MDKCMECGKPANAIKASQLPGGVDGRDGVRWCGGCGAVLDEGVVRADMNTCKCGRPAIDRGRCADNYYYGQCVPRPGQYMGD